MWKKDEVIEKFYIKRERGRKKKFGQRTWRIFSNTHQMKWSERKCGKPGGGEGCGWCTNEGPETEVHELMQNKDNQVRISVRPRGIIIIIKLLAMNKWVHSAFLKASGSKEGRMQEGRMMETMMQYIKGSFGSNQDIRPFLYGSFTSGQLGRFCVGFAVVSQGSQCRL